MEFKYVPSTQYYDANLEPVDHKIVSLIAQRQSLSDGRPGFPHESLLTEWAEQHAVPVPILHQLFSTLYHWHIRKERIEPQQYERFVPVMAACQHGDLLIAIPYIRQYQNCSVLAVNLERRPLSGRGHLKIEPAIDGFDWQSHGGSGRDGFALQEFIITPRIPDDRIPHLVIQLHVESIAGPRPRWRDHDVEPMPPTTVELTTGKTP